MTNLEQIRKKITERITTMDSSEILNLLDVLNGSASDMIMDTRELFSCSICRGKYGVCTVEAQNNTDECRIKFKKFCSEEAE